jgi:hypothetical protein
LTIHAIRVSLGLRATTEIKRKLDEAAQKSARSQSQEAELRLERSFELEHFEASIAEIGVWGKRGLDRGFGRELAGTCAMQMIRN